jgi:hypothetical protein
MLIINRLQLLFKKMRHKLMEAYSATKLRRRLKATL